MILKGAEIARYLARPDPSRPALLIYGQDAMRVAMKRAEAVKALVGEKADEEMRLTRLPGAALRKEPAQLLDAVKEVGFFPGQRVVLVEDAPDAAADAIREALSEWKPGDAAVVVTAGGLGKASALRKLFEPHPAAVTAPIYDDPPGEEEVARWLADAGLRHVPQAAMKEMMVLARALDPGDLRQTIEKIGLYKHGDDTPLTPEEIALMAPATIEADLDELIHIVAERREGEFGTMMRRIEGQGVNPVTLCIAALRHFRALHGAAADPAGPGVALSRMRPPVFGPRRDRMARQAQAWGMGPLEEAVRSLLDCDLSLRSSTRAPQMALVERALIRLAMTRGRR
ncbi:DNA polymerase III subunit delta [Paracoccus sp. WLY502]|uniref:DNA polymerase III subunit delta n=1 Tax=Paracoccus yibinensis TaxID=3068891 RepID=UPI002796E265|nr:DNA polymerase III subunit delta [Paracoccus sp. WLY502]MDQ1901471.1 DNA polymerase III subunit delta [Paracoccus sp. WLY502]